MWTQIGKRGRRMCSQRIVSAMWHATYIHTSYCNWQSRQAGSVLMFVQNFLRTHFLSCQLRPAFYCMPYILLIQTYINTSNTIYICKPIFAAINAHICKSRDNCTLILNSNCVSITRKFAFLMVPPLAERPTPYTSLLF